MSVRAIGWTFVTCIGTGMGYCLLRNYRTPSRTVRYPTSKTPAQVSADYLKKFEPQYGQIQDPNTGKFNDQNAGNLIRDLLQKQQQALQNKSTKPVIIKD